MGLYEYGEDEQGGYDSYRYGQGYAYDGYGAQEAPLDRKGRPIKDRFGLKLTFSIIEIFTAFLFGLLAVIFTCLQHGAYKKHNWESFKSFKLVSTIMLWIGLAISLIEAGIIVIFIAVFASMDDFYDDMLDEVINGEETLPFLEDEEDWDWLEEEDYSEIEETAEIYTFTYEGAELTVPLSVQEFCEILDPEFYEDIDEYTIGAGTDEFLSWGIGFNYLDIYNTSDEDLAAILGTIGGVDIDLSQGQEFSYQGCITQDSTLDDLVELLGEGYSEYETSDDCMEYYWYTANGFVDFGFDTDGSMVRAGIYNYGSLDAQLGY